MARRNRLRRNRDYAHDPVAQDKGPFSLKKLTEDTYALYGRGGNIGFAVTEEGVVVIDDQFADLAPGIAEQIKSVTSKPVRFLINTHHHGDHTGGNGFFIKMTTIIAHDPSVGPHCSIMPFAGGGAPAEGRPYRSITPLEVR